MPMLRGMKVVNPSLSTFPSIYKVQQSNSKLLRLAKQHSLAFGARLCFQSLRKEEQTENQKNPSHFCSADFWAQLISEVWAYVQGFQA